MGGNILQRTHVLFATVLVFVLFGTAASTNLDSSLTLLSHKPRTQPDTSTSINWSGYAVQTTFTGTAQTNVVTDVSGQWTVPAVDCSAVKGFAYSSGWVGMDGFSSNTVEQIGTDHDCNRGKPTYFAWWEMYPAGTQIISTLPVGAGDVITAEVKYLGSNQFQLSIGNTTKHTNFSTTQTGTVQRSSAEWILEAPGRGTSAPLANFGTINFSKAKATLSLQSSQTGPIDNGSYWADDEITMENMKGDIKAQPSGLTDSGGTSSFGVTWVHSK